MAGDPFYKNRWINIEQDGIVRANRLEPGCGIP
jgi:hypothetical protein